MMLSQCGSWLKTASGNSASAMPPRYLNQALRGDSTTSSTLADSLAGRPAVTVSMLLTETNLLRAHLAEQAGRTHNQNHQENQEPHRAAQHRVDVVTGKRLNDPHDQAAQVGAPDAAQPPEHHHGKRGQDEVAPHAGSDR